MKYIASKSLKLPIISFVLSAFIGGNNNSKALIKNIATSFLNLLIKSNKIEKLCQRKYITIETSIVNILDINVEKKKTSDKSISNFKNVKNKDITIRKVISISLKNKTNKNNNDCIAIIIAIINEKPKNFQIINSYLLIGFDIIRKIVFHSISLKRSWLQTNKTQISQNISIIASQKSTIILLSSHRVKLQRDIENIINKKAKNIII